MVVSIGEVNQLHKVRNVLPILGTLELMCDKVVYFNFV
jgi:hypothetical protein